MLLPAQLGAALAVDCTVIAHFAQDGDTGMGATVRHKVPPQTRTLGITETTNARLVFFAVAS